jgi:hypothetical protein
MYTRPIFPLFGTRIVFSENQSQLLQFHPEHAAYHITLTLLYTSISKKVVAAENNKQQHKTANNICILLLIHHLDAIILVVL